MRIKTIVLAAAAAVSLAAPAAAFAQDYHGDHGYARGAYGYNYGRGDGYAYRHDDGYGWRRGYDHDWRARWDGPARYRHYEGRGYGWRGDYGRYGHYDYRD